MTPSDPVFGSPHDLAQLQRLRALRAEAAERRLLAQRRVCEAAQAAVEAAARRIEVERQRVQRQARHRVGAGAADLPRFGALDAAFREDLDDARDRAEYDLIAERDTLAEVLTALQARRREGAREQARRDAVTEALARSRAAVARAHERHAESEAEDTRRGSPFPPPPDRNPR